jgi:hypothetical protein
MTLSLKTPLELMKSPGRYTMKFLYNALKEIVNAPPTTAFNPYPAAAVGSFFASAIDNNEKFLATVSKSIGVAPATLGQVGSTVSCEAAGITALP